MPVQITGPVATGVKNGFVSAGASMSRIFESSGFQSTTTGVQNYLPGYYYEYTSNYVTATDYDYGTVSTFGLVAGHWLPYPLSFAYAEYGSDGAVVVNASGSSTAPLFTSTESFDTYDYQTNITLHVTEDNARDVLTDDPSGTFVVVDSYHRVNAATGELLLNYSDVTSQRSFGHQIYFSVVSGVQRNDPNQTFDFFSYANSTDYVYPLPTPANLGNTYRVTLNVLDGAGQSHSSDSTFDFVNGPYSSGSSSGCFSFTYDSPFGGHEESSGCSSGFGATQNGSGATAY
jgi:hypothetical protein